MARASTLTALLLIGLLAACTTEPGPDPAEDPTDDGVVEEGDTAGDGALPPMDPPEEDPPPPTSTNPTTPPPPTPPPSQTCSYGSDVYTPYPGSGVYPIGRVAELPWRGTSSSYPDGIEDFRDYASGATIECGSNKSQRSYVDVTAGCLYAVGTGAAMRGRVGLTSSGIYRSFALGHTPGDARPVKWTDQAVEYSFFYTIPATGNVGFKAFTRYTTEYDLYVASWRLDGVVQIQKKECGAYTILKRTTSIAPPTPGVWHTIRFEAIGDELRLYLDGQLKMSVTDDTFTSGTAGIRIDQMKDAVIDNWTVFAP